MPTPLTYPETPPEVIELIETIFRTRLAEAEHQLTRLCARSWSVEVGSVSYSRATLNLELLPIILTDVELDQFVELANPTDPS